MRTSVRAPGARRTAARTRSTASTGSPSSSATRARSDASKSSSPSIACRVTSATCASQPGLRGEHLDDLALHERRVDVHHDQPPRPPPQRRRLDGDVDRLLHRLGRQLGPQRRRCRRRRRAGRTPRAGSSTAAGRARCWRRSAARRRATPAKAAGCSGAPSTVTWWRGAGRRVLVAVERRELDLDVELGGAGARRAARTRAAVAGSGDDDAEQQPVVHDDLLDVAELDVVLGEHVEQRRRDARPVAAGDREQQAHATPRRSPQRPAHSLARGARRASLAGRPSVVAAARASAGSRAPARLARVDRAADVLAGQVQHAGELAGLHQQLPGALRVAAGQLVLVEPAAGLAAQVGRAPRRPRAASGRRRGRAGWRRTRRRRGAGRARRRAGTARGRDRRPRRRSAVQVTVVTVPSKGEPCDCSAGTRPVPVPSGAQRQDALAGGQRGAGERARARAGRPRRPGAGSTRRRRSTPAARSRATARSSGRSSAVRPTTVWASSWARHPLDELGQRRRHRPARRCPRRPAARSGEGSRLVRHEQRA